MAYFFLSLPSMHTLLGMGGSCLGLSDQIHISGSLILVLGVSLAFALRPYQLSYRQIKYFSFPGELLMRMLQMLVLPLIVSSLVTGERAQASGLQDPTESRLKPGAKAVPSRTLYMEHAPSSESLAKALIPIRPGIQSPGGATILISVTFLSFSLVVIYLPGA